MSRKAIFFDIDGTLPVSYTHLFGCSNMRSASVLLPWSMWAMMLKFRIRSRGIAK